MCGIGGSEGSAPRTSGYDTRQRSEAVLHRIASRLHQYRRLSPLTAGLNIANAVYDDAVLG